MSMSEELINAMYIKPYTGMIPYLSLSSALTVSDFENCPLAKDHWLDLPMECSHRKGRKKHDPNRVSEAFGSYSDHEVDEVCEEMLSAISSDFNYYQTVSWLILQLHKTTLSDWCHVMCAATTPADELAIFALSKLYNRHSVVYTKDKMWSTIGTSTPMNEKDVYQQCDLKFILMGKDHYVQLIKKPSVSMPVLPLQPMESVYESGYYEDVTPVENITDTNTIITPPLVGQPSQNNDVPAMTPDTTQYCAVYSCEVTHTNNNGQSENPTLPEQDTVNFPIAAKVCETTSNSSLHEFNPLNDSEPNLEFDMMEKDNVENPDLHVKLIQDARTRKWQVKIRNLTKEQVDFIARPRLLPTLAKTDAVVFEHHNTTLSVKHDEHKQEQSAPANADHEVPNQEKPNGSAESNVQKETTTNNDANKIQPNEPSTQAAKPRRPRRSTAKNINYSTMTIMEDPAISDSDEYLPQPTPPPKLNNKRKLSASRIVDQRHKKQHTDHDDPKRDKNNSEVQEPQDPEPTADKKSTKGELNIKTVSLPKIVRARTFKCQICQFICHSERERNKHHKDNHGPLTCVVCNEGFNTPSGLHRHKYRHTDLKFTCETCGERFPL